MENNSHLYLLALRRRPLCNNGLDVVCWQSCEHSFSFFVLKIEVPPRVTLLSPKAWPITLSYSPPLVLAKVGIFGIQEQIVAIDP
jgi:hypothetical protein